MSTIILLPEKIFVISSAHVHLEESEEQPSLKLEHKIHSCLATVDHYLAFHTHAQHHKIFYKSGYV